MDSKQLTDFIAKISDYLDNTVQEGIPVIRYIDESMESDGIKIDSNLIVQEVDGELILERVIEISDTELDSIDVFYEEIATVETIEELLPAIRMALEENQEELDTLEFFNYENEIEDDEDEDEDD